MHFKKSRRVFLTTTLSLGVAGILFPTTANAKPDKFDTTNIPDNLIYKDADGNFIDLGGIEVTIADWWSDNDNPADECDHCMGEGYYDWLTNTYNFTIKKEKLERYEPNDGWGEMTHMFIDYVYGGGDEHNYVFTLHDDPDFSKSVYEGICYDLNQLSCLDFTQKKFKDNRISDQFSIGHEVYAMQSGQSEPRGGLFFNKQLLVDAGVDPESLYDMQANGTWTWDEFVKILQKVQIDKDGDGLLDIRGFCGNGGNIPEVSIASNGTYLIGQDDTHHFTYNLENPDVLESLEFASDIMDKYALLEPLAVTKARAENPEEEEIPYEWDFYKQSFIEGEAVFLLEDIWAVNEEDYLDSCNMDLGYVMFPKGPKATDYTNIWSNNFVVIPGCYDDDRAWKIAFAWNLYSNYIEDDYWKEFYAPAFGDDKRAVNETLAQMCEKGVVSFAGLIPGISTGEDLLWNFPNENVKDLISDIAPKWQKYISKANKNVDKKLATQTFKDVKFGSWYVKNVQFAMDNEIMQGKSKDDVADGQKIFDPDKPITRAEFVMVLFNKEKKPDADLSEAFADVNNEEWYAQAVAWAYANKVTAGYNNGKFGVNDPISREQIATMLHNYGTNRGYNLSTEGKNTDLSRFADSDKISTYAVEPLKWATASEIMFGDTAAVPHLNPGKSASRAECAAMVERFMVNIENFE